jgi:hypothetical protein
MPKFFNHVVVTCGKNIYYSVGFRLRTVHVPSMAPKNRDMFIPPV